MNSVQTHAINSVQTCQSLAIYDTFQAYIATCHGKA